MTTQPDTIRASVLSGEAPHLGVGAMETSRRVSLPRREGAASTRDLEKWADLKDAWLARRRAAREAPLDEGLNRTLRI